MPTPPDARDEVREARHEPSVARMYRSDDVEITWDAARCIHWGACWNGSWAAFNPRRRPWIDPNAESPERLDEIIAECPTGALSLQWLDGRTAASEIGAPVSVEPSLDGPLLIRGPIEVHDRTGRPIQVSTRLALCRCGHSAHKPFCDDTHTHIGFRSNDAHLDGHEDVTSP